jgi:hypothetical protein
VDVAWLSDWWNAVELWIAQLPVCAAGAWLIDRAVDFVGNKVNRTPEPPAGDCD